MAKSHSERWKEALTAAGADDALRGNSNLQRLANENPDYPSEAQKARCCPGPLNPLVNVDDG
jgi:hypothetical protein